VTLNGSAVVVNGSQSVFPGATTTYTLVATNGLGSSSAAVTVNVDAGTAVLGAPVITAPSAGQVIGVAGVTFSWNAVGGAQGYGLRLFDKGTGLTVFSGSFRGNSSTSTIIGLPNGQYTFAVRACGSDFNPSNCGLYGTVDFITNLIAPQDAPSITSPSDGSVLTSSTNTISWTAVTPNPILPSMTYEVVIENLSNGATEAQISVIHPSTTVVQSLGSGIYELKVRACQAACGPFSSPSSFTVVLPPVPATAPVITSADVAGGNQLTVSWTPVTNADLYQVQVVQPSGGPGGSALTVAARQTGLLTTTAPVPPGNASIVVAACNGNGCGPMSDPVSINPPGPAPGVPSVGTPMDTAIVNGRSTIFSWNRISGDDGSNTLYRLYVQDLSRQNTALDVYTNQNFWGAYFKAEGARYGVAVIANPTSVSPVTGPASSFSVKGTSSVAPTMVAPGHQSTVRAGNIQLAWTPVPGATLYEYFVAVQGQSAASSRGVSVGTFVLVPLTAIGGSPTNYSGVVRACPAGATCADGSDAGWGPWSTQAGPGVTNFTVTP
jgi:hypothetical protein